MPSDPPVSIEGVQCIAATGKALLVYVPDLNEEVWLPRSQIIEDGSDDLDVGDTGTLMITSWIAKQKGIE